MSEKRKARNPFDEPSVNPRYRGATPADMVRALTRPKNAKAREAFDKLRERCSASEHQSRLTRRPPPVQAKNIIPLVFSARLEA